MIKPALTLLAAFFAIYTALHGQPVAADHQWLETGRIRARITPFGLQPDLTNGGFLMLDPDGMQAPVNLLNFMLPWVGGVDPAGNLKLAADMNYTGSSDFNPGFRDLPNSGQVWMVTREQVQLHFADFQDNGIVDNPIPAILAWPAFGNPHSMDLNGFILQDPSQEALGAGYYDFNLNNQYDPLNGDYPDLGIQTTGTSLPWETLVFAPFHSSETNPFTQASPIDLDASLKAYTFECAQLPYAHQTAFFSYKYVNVGSELLDSVYYGFHTGFAIGQATDDYIGTRPADQIFFAYNADTTLDAVAGPAPPMMAFLSHTLLDFDYGMSSVLPLWQQDLPTPPGAQLPLIDFEFYSYLTGRWRDGSPLTVGGTGYQSGPTVTQFAFHDHPGDPSGWSELAMGLPPRQQGGLASHGPDRLLPGGLREVTFALSFSDQNGPAAQLQELHDFKSLQSITLYHVDPVTLPDVCAGLATEGPEENTAVTIFPNPATDHLNMRSETGSPLTAIDLSDFLGRTVEAIPIQGMKDHAEVPVGNLTPGMYLIRWQLRDGRQGMNKVMVGR